MKKGFGDLRQKREAYTTVVIPEFSGLTEQKSRQQNVLTTKFLEKV